MMVKGAANPVGLPHSVFENMRAALVQNRAQFFKDITIPFYGYNRLNADVSDGAREHYWSQGMMGSIKSQYDCIKAFSETDFTEDLRRIDIPVLVMHGDDDQIVPIQSSALLTAKLLRNSILKVYPGRSHGFATTHAAEVNADLLAFIHS
jgi:non-heme chloroperoxidase